MRCRAETNHPHWSADMQDKLEANKQSAIAFYRIGYLWNPANAVELCVGAE